MTRICSKCGEERDEAGGKECEDGHWICASCLGGRLLSWRRKTCPICGWPLH